MSITVTHHSPNTLEFNLEHDFTADDAVKGNQALTELAKDRNTLNLIMNLSQLEHMTREGILKDMHENTKFVKNIHKCAVVDKAHHHSIMMGLMKTASLFTGISVKVFDEAELKEARR